MWNLQRDGGNVGATAERVLSGRGLEVVSLACCSLALLEGVALLLLHLGKGGAPVSYG